MIAVLDVPRQIGWSHRRTATGDPRLPVPPDALPWRPCGRCWGQRIEWLRANGQWLSRPCVACLGIGEVPST